MQQTGAADLETEVVVLLERGPATMRALEDATGRTVVDVWRAIARLFAAGMVEPIGERWQLRRPDRAFAASPN